MKPRRKRLNVTRRRGRFYFRRETRRYDDGRPWGGRDGETLWIMTSDKRPRRVVFVHKFCWPIPSPKNAHDVSFHLGTYRIGKPIWAARMIRAYLLASD